MLILVPVATSREGMEETDFAQRAVWSGDTVITQGKVRQERLLASWLSQCPGDSTKEDEQTEGVRVTAGTPGT